MDAVDEGDNGGSLSRECKLPFEPLERGSVGDSALNASPADLVRRSSAIFWRRSSGGSGGWFVAISVMRRWFCFLCSSWSWSGARGWRANSRHTGRVAGISSVTAVSAATVGRSLALYQPCKGKLLSIIS